ncbi:MAG TPA: tetratricopeptide repeat protein [Phycisphaerae bacterium]|nr:tetratricopeptide repeat protein [Phycisphaerae bacterium]
MPEDAWAADANASDQIFRVVGASLKPGKARLWELTVSWEVVRTATWPKAQYVSPITATVVYMQGDKDPSRVQISGGQSLIKSIGEFMYFNEALEDPNSGSYAGASLAVYPLAYGNKQPKEANIPRQGTFTFPLKGFPRGASFQGKGRLAVSMGYIYFKNGFKLVVDAKPLVLPVAFTKKGKAPAGAKPISSSGPAARARAASQPTSSAAPKPDAKHSPRGKLEEALLSHLLSKGKPTSVQFIPPLSVFKDGKIDTSLVNRMNDAARDGPPSGEQARAYVSRLRETHPKLRFLQMALKAIPFSSVTDRFGRPAPLASVTYASEINKSLKMTLTWYPYGWLTLGVGEGGKVRAGVIDCEAIARLPASVPGSEKPVKSDSEGPPPSQDPKRQAPSEVRAKGLLGLAESYLNQGLKDQARKMLKSIVKEYPDTKAAKAAAKKLKQLE